MAPQDLVDHARIGLAARRFHDLTGEETHRLRLAGLVVRCCLGIGGDGLRDRLLELARVADLRQAALGDQLVRRAAGGGDLLH